MTKGQSIVLERGVVFFATINTVKEVKAKKKVVKNVMWALVKMHMPKTTVNELHDFILLDGFNVSEA